MSWPYQHTRYLALAAGCIFLVSLFLYSFTNHATLEAEATNKPDVAAPAKPAPIHSDGGAAVLYANAYQEGNCDEIIRLTAWMSDRLRRVAIESSDPATLQRERKELCAKILWRPYEDNVLRAEGIDDQFIFPAGCTIAVESKDGGRSDLGNTVRERVWLRVTYPRRDTAPLAQDTGAELKPVRAWTVGVNVGREVGVVLKASVRGNLEIKDASALFDWPNH
ncbi:MAG: hypothetical protein SGI88_19205 [Candidatus Hydrogenedentes bacterium]|nr:hypothetical protein [Candidatus Hydrogenedentota bacterium]